MMVSSCPTARCVKMVVVPEWFSATFVPPAKMERLNVDSLNGETAVEVWGEGGD